MIKSFLDKETEKVYNQEFSRKFPAGIQKRALVKLMMLDAAGSESDLLFPPGNRYEHLSGKMKGRSSIRINDQWRITFRFEDGHVFEVKIEDYH